MSRRGKGSIFLIFRHLVDEDVGFSKYLNQLVSPLGTFISDYYYWDLIRSFKRYIKLSYRLNFSWQRRHFYSKLLSEGNINTQRKKTPWYKYPKRQEWAIKFYDTNFQHAKWAWKWISNSVKIPSVQQSSLDYKLLLLQTVSPRTIDTFCIVTYFLTIFIWILVATKFCSLKATS